MPSHRTLPRLLSVAVAAATLSTPAIVSHAQEAALEEVMVTARRKTENLQDVPVSVQVLSGEAIEEFAMTTPAELAKLAPGLSLTLANPDTPVVILRGVRWTQASGTPAIPIYLNEVSFDPVQVLQTMYDISQIEILRGPQGTTRGAPSISGAITMKTRRPEFDGIDGYVSGLYGQDDHWNSQGAINLPIIEDKLAVRLAGNMEQVGHLVKSVNDTQSPSLQIQSARFSVRYEPTDTLSLDAMIQRLDQNAKLYDQMVGSGSPGVPSLGVAPNYNGPPLSKDDYRGVQELADTINVETDLATVNAVWDVLGHTLSYNLGSQNSASPDDSASVVDQTNLLIGDGALNIPRGEGDRFYVNELRLSSDRNEDRFFDYDLGFYSQRTKGKVKFASPGAFLDGAYGNPFTDPASPYINETAFNHYTLQSSTDIKLETENYSYYGNVVLHLPYDTEFSSGLRWIHDKRPAVIAPTTQLAYIAATSDFGLPCSTLDPRLLPSPIYEGVCDFPIEAMTLPVESYNKTFEKTIWNASLSHHFTDDLLAYTTVGTSWRQGLPAIANQGLPADLLFPEPEEATSYEIGVKSEWEGWLRANAAVYQIDYKGQLTQFEAVPYWNTVAENVAATSLAFFYNVDATVQGAEADITALVTDNLTLGVNVSYATIESEGDEVPCLDDSRPITATNPINLCSSKKGASLNASPEFQANLYGNYTMPLGAFDGYARFIANYQGSNDNVGTSIDSADSYTTIDLFFGITGNEGGWDVGVYGKNVFDEKVELTRNGFITGYGVDEIFGPSGYDRVTVTAPMELGVSARYSFGVN